MHSLTFSSHRKITWFPLLFAIWRKTICMAPSPNLIWLFSYWTSHYIIYVYFSFGCTTPIYFSQSWQGFRQFMNTTTRIVHIRMISVMLSMPFSFFRRVLLCRCECKRNITHIHAQHVNHKHIYPYIVYIPVLFLSLIDHLSLYLCVLLQCDFWYIFIYCSIHINIFKITNTWNDHQK